MKKKNSELRIPISEEQKELLLKRAEETYSSSLADYCRKILFQEERFLAEKFHNQLIYKKDLEKKWKKQKSK